MPAELIHAQMAHHGWLWTRTFAHCSGRGQALISTILPQRLINITANTMDRLATALDLSPEDLFRAAPADGRAPPRPDTRLAAGPHQGRLHKDC